MRRALLRGAMAVTGVRHWRPVERRAHDPEAAQAETLAGILRDNADTTFGRLHGFASATTPAAFRAATPVCDYEALRPFVEEQRTTGARTLTKEAPIFYAQTSGSTGQPKYIPVTPTALEQHRTEQALFSYLQHRARPEAFDGRAWGIMGAAVEGHLDSGHVVGSVSGYLYRALPRALQARFVVPPEVSSVHDYEARYLTVLRLALGARDITYLGTPNPSTFLRLLSLLDQHRERLARSLSDGTLPVPDAVPDEVRRVLAPFMARDPARARELEALSVLTYADLWPRIALLTTWTGGSCGIALASLRHTLPSNCSVMELGYQATEFRGSLALDTDCQAGLPPLHHHFLEFVPQQAWEDGRHDFIGLGALEQGRRYYVFVTTAAGLYRYPMNDIVEVDGLFERTPLLRFVQKGRGVTSVTGEKLYEEQAIGAVLQAIERSGLGSPFFLVVADEVPAGYTLFIECGAGQDTPDLQRLGVDVDRLLGEANGEYQSKRASGRLAALGVERLTPGSADAFKAHYVARGQREGQFKPMVLQYRRDLTWPVDRHVVA